MTLRELLEANPQGLTIDEIRVKTMWSHKKIKEALQKLPVEFDGEFYYLVQSAEHRAELKAQFSAKKESQHVASAQPTQTTKIVKPRNKPFTPNPTNGYQVVGNKVKIFLNRKACSKTLTLTVDDLQELVNAVRKVS